MEAIKSSRCIPIALIQAMLVLVLFALAACGPDVIRGRPPFVTLSGLNLEGERLNAEFRFSNQNGVPMTINATRIVVSVRDTDLVRHSQRLDLSIDANSSEDLRVEQSVDPFVQTLLVSLDSGDLASLPFDLTGAVQTTEDGELRFEYTGYLYRVPGRPGHYRSAVTQSRELRPTDPLRARDN